MDWNQTLGWPCLHRRILYALWAGPRWRPICILRFAGASPPFFLSSDHKLPLYSHWALGQWEFAKDHVLVALVTSSGMYDGWNIPGFESVWKYIFLRILDSSPLESVGWPPGHFQVHDRKTCDGTVYYVILPIFKVKRAYLDLHMNHDTWCHKLGGVPRTRLKQLPQRGFQPQIKYCRSPVDMNVLMYIRKPSY